MVSPGAKSTAGTPFELYAARASTTSSFLMIVTVGGLVPLPEFPRGSLARTLMVQGPNGS